MKVRIWMIDESINKIVTYNIVNQSIYCLKCSLTIEIVSSGKRHQYVNKAIEMVS